VTPITLRRITAYSYYQEYATGTSQVPAAGESDREILLEQFLLPCGEYTQVKEAKIYVPTMKALRAPYAEEQLVTSAVEQPDQSSYDLASSVRLLSGQQDPEQEKHGLNGYNSQFLLRYCALVVGTTLPVVRNGIR